MQTWKKWQSETVQTQPNNPRSNTVGSPTYYYVINTINVFMILEIDILEMKIIKTRYYRCVRFYRHKSVQILAFMFSGKTRGLQKITIPNVFNSASNLLNNGYVNSVFLLLQSIRFENHKSILVLKLRLYSRKYAYSRCVKI